MNETLNTIEKDLKELIAKKETALNKLNLIEKNIFNLETSY